MLHKFTFKDYKPIHPVTFFNAKTKKPVGIDVLSDTGAGVTTLEIKYAKQLGVDLDTATKGTAELFEYYNATITIKIGNLKAIPSLVTFAEGDIHFNILGRNSLNAYNTYYTWNTVTYEETPGYFCGRDWWYYY